MEICINCNFIQKIRLHMNLSGLKKIFGGKKKYIDEQEYAQQRNGQELYTSETLEVLKKHIVLDDTELPLEYFFYTNHQNKARNLAQRLEQMNYTAAYRTSASDKNTFVITGWTPKMNMSQQTVTEWAEKMC